MGRITDILRLILMRRKLKKRIRRIKKIIEVYSADTNRIDTNGGPYYVEITGDICEHGNSWSSNCSDCNEEEG